MHAMKSYMKYVRAQQSLVELTSVLVKLPSRRTEFFNFMIRVTGLPPNSLKMALCTTSSGATLSPKLRRKVAKALSIPEHTLFPEERLAPGSLVSIYAELSYQPYEYGELIEDLQKNTESSRQAVISWLYGRHYPREHSQRVISDLLGQPIISLFPVRGKQKCHTRK